MLRFAVRDTGPGVPPDAIERIFAEFEQAESGPARRHSGTGLGLAISKRLVDEMGGRIGVISVPGAGATFTVDLPFAVPAQVASLGASWPRPADGEKVLLVLEGDMEASLVCDQLVAMGASVARVPLKDAERIATEAASTGVPFTALLTDRAGVAAGAGRLIGLLRKAPGIGRQQRTAVIIDPSERGDIPVLPRRDFNFYLVRPVRPLSLLNQLFGDLDETQAKAIDAATSARRRTRASRAAARGLSILLAEDNDINALLACTVLEKSGARVVRVRNGAEAIAKAGAALGEANGRASTSSSWTSTCRTWTGSRRRDASGRSTPTMPSRRKGGRRSWRSRPMPSPRTAPPIWRPVWTIIWQSRSRRRISRRCSPAGSIRLWPKRHPGAAPRKSARKTSASCALSPDCHMGALVSLFHPFPLSLVNLSWTPLKFELVC